MGELTALRKNCIPYVKTRISDILREAPSKLKTKFKELFIETKIKILFVLYVLYDREDIHNNLYGLYSDYFFMNVLPII